ncbi:hypothetical protein ACFL5Q_05575 [Planctomycetota bacterium]
MSNTLYAQVTSGAHHERGSFADGTDGWEVAYRVTTRGRQEVQAMVDVIREAVEQAEELAHNGPNLRIGHIPDEADCCRIRYGLQCALSAAFSIPLDSVEFAVKRDPLAGGVPVSCHAQVPQDTRDRMFDLVRGYCIAFTQRLS